jgi:uncharacterized cupredoxin-like copper-binding protein
VFPATSAEIRERAQSNNGPTAVAEALERLPEGQTFENFQAVWEALRGEGRETVLSALSFHRSTERTKGILGSVSYPQQSGQWLRRLLVPMALLMAVASACRQAPVQQVIQVELKEYAIGSDKTSVEAGEVTFTAVNQGTENHELVVIKTELDLLSLPTVETGAVNEEGTGIQVIGEIEEFPAGETKSASFDLAAGNYVLICNVVETEEDGTIKAHYKEGMRASLTVE